MFISLNTLKVRKNAPMYPVNIIRNSARITGTPFTTLVMGSVLIPTDSRDSQSVLVKATCLFSWAPGKLTVGMNTKTSIGNISRKPPSRAMYTTSSVNSVFPPMITKKSLLSPLRSLM